MPGEKATCSKCCTILWSLSQCKHYSAREILSWGRRKHLQMARFPNHQRRASSDKGGGGPGPRYWLHNLNYNHEVVPHMLGASPDPIVFLLSTSCKQQHILFGVFYWLTLFWDGVFGSFITNTVILWINLAQSSPWKKSTPPPVVANVRYGQQLLLTYRDPHHSTIKIALLTTIWNSCRHSA